MVAANKVVCHFKVIGAIKMFAAGKVNAAGKVVAMSTICQHQKLVSWRDMLLDIIW